MSSVENTPDLPTSRRICVSRTRFDAGVEMLVAAGVLDRLEGHAAHAIPGQRVADDVGDLMVVDAALHHHDQGRRQADRFERLERLPADPR